MRRSQSSFVSALFLALLAITASRPVTAQDMPPILAPLELPATAAKPATPTAPAASPTAEAAIPPAAAVTTSPAKKPPVMAVLQHPPAMPAHHVTPAAEKKKFAVLLKRLAQAHHETLHHETVHHVAAQLPPAHLPPGTVVAPPGYYPPGPYYQRLVYAGPYAGWGGYRRPYPYYDYP